MDTKQCRICGAEKPLTEFYSHPNTTDGRLSQCKDCKKKQTKEAYWKDPEASRERDRHYYKERNHASGNAQKH